MDKIDNQTDIVENKEEEQVEKIMRQRLAVDLPIHIHEEVKLVARQHNCTITRWVLKTIIQKLKIERLYNEKANRKKMPKLQ